MGGNSNIAKAKAIEKANRKRILKVNPQIDDKPGIYFLTRRDLETGLNYFYIGLAHKSLLTRMAQHLVGFQHIDNSIKKRGFYSDDNQGGWKLNFLHYPADEVEEWEQYWILEYQKRGYQNRYNKTSGGSKGTKKINDYRPAKGYRDGIAQGRKSLGKEIRHIIDTHLTVTIRQGKENNKVSRRAFEKFWELLGGDEENGEGTEDDEH